MAGHPDIVKVPQRSEYVEKGLCKSEKSVIPYLTVQVLCAESKTAGNSKLLIYLNANPSLQYLHLLKVNISKTERILNNYFTNKIQYAGHLFNI